MEPRVSTRDVPAQVIPTVSVLLALVFLMTGIMKLAGGWSDRFEMWGYPVWFFYFIGATETAAGVALMRRRTRLYGALAIIVVMLGALATLWQAGDTDRIAIPCLALLLAAVVANYSRQSPHPGSR